MPTAAMAQVAMLMPTEQVRYRRNFKRLSGEHGRDPLPYEIAVRPCKGEVRRIDFETTQQFAPFLAEIGAYFTRDESPGDRVLSDTHLPLYVNVLSSPIHAVMYMNLSRLQMNRFKQTHHPRPETCAECRQDRSSQCTQDWCFPCVHPIKTIVQFMFQGMFPGMSFPLILCNEMGVYDMALLVFRSAYLALKYALRRYLKRRRQVVENVRFWAWATKQSKYKTMKFALPWDVVVSVGRWIRRPLHEPARFEQEHYKRRLRRPNYEALCEQDAALYFKTFEKGVMDVGQRQWTKRQKREPKRDVVDDYLKELYTVTSPNDPLRFREAVLERRMTIYINQ